MGSSVVQTPNTFLLDLIEDLQRRVNELEANSLTQADAIMESLQVGEPINSPSGFGAASLAGDLIAEGNFNLGSPTTPATVDGDGAVSGDLSVEGTITGTGMVTGGNSHDHDGGDGAAIPEAGLAAAVSAQLVTNGDSHNHDGGDGAAIDTGALASKAVTTAKIDDLAVDTLQLANDSVDSGKAGNRVPQFYRRQGGSSSDWNTTGSTTYIPGAVRMQAGARACSSGSNSITFPAGFSGKPIVIIDPTSRQTGWVVYVSTVGASSFTIITDYSVNVRWLAIGPE